jgi:hypothetical protein
MISDVQAIAAEVIRKHGQNANEFQSCKKPLAV